MGAAPSGKANIWLGGVALAVIAGCFYESTQVASPASGSDPGPAAYPQFLLIALGVCAVAVMFIRGDLDGDDQPRDWKVVLGVLGSLALYIFCLQFIGYTVSTAIFVVLTLLIAGERRWWLVVGYAVALACVLYFVFSEYLNVSLPIGLIEELM